MDQTTHFNPAQPNHTPRTFWRVLACVAVVYFVFVGARFSAGVLSLSEADRFDPDDSVADMLEEALLWWDHSSSEPDPPDNTDAMDDLVDDILAPGDAEDVEPEPDEPEPQPGDWATFAGYDAFGNQWIIDHPATWEATTTDFGALFAPPGRTDAATVVVESTYGDLALHATDDLDHLLTVLKDAELLDRQPSTLAGEAAVRAVISHTGPDGLATVTMYWVQAGDTTYLVAGEAGDDEAELQATVEQILASFSVVPMSLA